MVHRELVAVFILGSVECRFEKTSNLAHQTPNFTDRTAWDPAEVMGVRTSALTQREKYQINTSLDGTNIMKVTRSNR